MFRLTTVHAALAALLLCDGAQGFSFTPNFMPKSSLIGTPCLSKCPSALSLNMVMTSSSKAGTGKPKVGPAPLEVPDIPGQSKVSLVIIFAPVLMSRKPNDKKSTSYPSLVSANHLFTPCQ